jgi:hypothetical protein
VIVTAHRGAPVQAPSGVSPLQAKLDGFARAWNALPGTVKHVVVVRDVPYSTDATPDCVERAISRHRPAGTACAIPRRVALAPDPEATAAASGISPRGRLVDLTRFICDQRRCFPVVGGVLVHKDTGGHLTSLFARTLGPYLLADIDRALAGH